MPSDLAEKGTRFTLNRYQRFFNRKLTIKKPITFTDKIHHFIIAAHWQDIKIVTEMTDKINVRTYVASQIGLKYLNEVIWTSSKIDDAPLQDYACGNWILKTNHGCGGHQVIRQNHLNEIRQAIKNLLTKNYYFAAAEPQYFFIEPKAFIEKLVKRFRAKPVYIGGQLVYSIGMIFMAIARSTWGVILFSWSAGIMYSTLFTMPYLIVAHYHETDCVSISIKLKHNLFIFFCIKKLSGSACLIWMQHNILTARKIVS